MSLDDAVRQVEEHRAYSDTSFWAGETFQLVCALHVLHRLRNKYHAGELPEAQLQQRKVILDLVIKMCKQELKRSVLDLITATELWEKME